MLTRSAMQELIDAETPSHAAAELADVVFFALTAANVRGASLADADKQLDLRTLRVHHCTLFTCDPLPLYTLTTCRCGAGLAMQNESVAATCFGQVPKLLVQNRIREESQASPSFAVRACEWLPYALL